MTLARTARPALAALAAGLALAAAPAHAAVTLTGQAAGGWGYWDASALAVGTAGDLVYGKAASSSNYCGTFEAAGGSTAPLTDGKTATDGAGDVSQSTNAGNALFDLNGNWYATYTLGAGANGRGYDLSSVMVTTGHQDYRVNQGYDILVATTTGAGAVFTSLSGGAGFFYNSPDNGGAAQTTLTGAGGGLLASGVEQVKFQTLDGGSGVYRELGVFGAAAPAPAAPLAAVPEPGSVAAFLFGGLGLGGLLWKARPRRA